MYHAAKFYRGMNPAIKFYRGIRPAIKFYRGIRPAIKIYRGIRPAIKFYRGTNPEIKIYRGIRPAISYRGIAGSRDRGINMDVVLSFDIQKKYNGIELSVFLRLNNLMRAYIRLFKNSTVVATGDLNFTNTLSLCYKYFFSQKICSKR